MTDTRLDMYIKDTVNISRQKARELVEGGNVTVNGRLVLKPAFKISEKDIVKTINTEDVLKYAGRGGYKLEKAVNEFDIEIKGICIDIGASTGGFTDCMLQKGAEKVYAVDVGSNQLAEKLRNDKRVISMEKTDIREAEIEKGDFISCDVSFISLKKIFGNISKLLKDEGNCVFLIKPQFEAGRENLNKKGIVKNPKIHKKVIRDITESAEERGLYVKKLTFSPIRGGDGNIEYLAAADKINGNGVKQQDIDNVVEKAFANFKEG